MWSMWPLCDRRSGVCAGLTAVLVTLTLGVAPAWGISTEELFAPTGEAADDRLGSSVASAGDFNGDGFADVIVGAQYNDGGGTEAGRVYIYYGGLAADAVADLTMTGFGTEDYFGSSVAGAGDVNGDGFDDVIVGAPYNDGGGTEAGRVYIYYGGLAADAVADLTLTGAAVNDLFGVSVGGVGDVSGDGFDDVMVGALYNDGGGTDAGRAYVYYGGPGADAVADLTLTGAAVGDYFGISVGGAGDVNGDGFDDVIVGAYYSDAGGANAGRVYIYCGGPGADAVADLTLTGAAGGDLFGRSVDGAGDVDGDGFDDVIVGAVSNDVGGADAGRAYVIAVYPFHMQSPDGGEQWITGRPATVRWRGHDVADLSISMDAGVTWSTLVSGVGGDAENGITILAPMVETEFARVRVSYSGQQVKRSTSDMSDGVFRITEALDPPPAALSLVMAPAGEAMGDAFGSSSAAAGDVNGDGYGDVIVGAPGHDGARGRAYVYLSPSMVPDLVLSGEAVGDRFGDGVAGVGDMNGDGYDDVIVSGIENDAGGTDAGRAYVFFGGASPDAVADIVMTGEAASDNFGITVSSAGDMNGDGFADAIVGAWKNSVAGQYAGAAYVYFGGVLPDGTADLVLRGEAAYDAFSCVGAAGDMNGDGFADVIVGAPYNDAAGSDAGRAYAFFGGRAPDAVPDLVFTGAGSNDWFGHPACGAGDFNGDGYSDVAVGARYNDTGGVDAGRAYLYFGGPAADAVADLVMTGEAAYDAFGIRLGGGSDVNGDGYSDMVVGAVYNDAGGLDAGRAYVYYGGPGADAASDVVLTGESGPGGLFGASVAMAGDRTGDGMGDLLIGAYGDDSMGVDAGRAYVYDCSRYFVTAPAAGETWNVGATKSLSWMGGEPADLWLSVDGGDSYSLLRENIGGSPFNSTSLTVPHRPTRFAKVLFTPHDVSVSGRAESDSLFTIEASIALLNLKAEAADGGGVLLSWQTDPGPEDLAGYSVERAGTGSEDWTLLASLVRETTYHDVAGGPGTRYRLFGVNGLGEKLLLGETALAPRAALAAWPLPYRGGVLNVSFAIYGRLGSELGEATVTLHDLQGRLVRSIATGEFRAGHQATLWDGCDDGGRPVAAGVYFLRTAGGGETVQIKVVVIR